MAPASLPEKQPGKALGDYCALSEAERERRAKECADAEEEIHRLEMRLHEISEMNPVRKVGAFFEGSAITNALEKLYKDRIRLKSHLH